jgi:hypothetical protein
MVKRRRNKTARTPAEDKELSFSAAKLHENSVISKRVRNEKSFSLK